MLSSEFTQEMGALIRRLESRVRTDPDLQHDQLDDVLADLEKAIVVLCALHINLTRVMQR